MKPAPENVNGEVRHLHTFSHSIRWEYVLGLLVVLYVATQLLESRDGSTSETTGDVSESVVSEVDGAVPINVGGSMAKNQVTASEQGGI